MVANPVSFNLSLILSFASIHKTFSFHFFFPPLNELNRLLGIFLQPECLGTVI